MIISVDAEKVFDKIQHLFMIARKQPKCSLTDERIKKMYYIQTMDY